MRLWGYETEQDVEGLNVLYGYWNDEGWWEVTNWFVPISPTFKRHTMNKREAAELQMLAAIKVWLDCEIERRPTSGALGRLIQKYADEFADRPAHIHEMRGRSDQ